MVLPTSESKSAKVKARTDLARFKITTGLLAVVLFHSAAAPACCPLPVRLPPLIAFPARLQLIIVGLANLYVMRTKTTSKLAASLHECGECGAAVHAGQCCAAGAPLILP
jgi:hypothetical protein